MPGRFERGQAASDHEAQPPSQREPGRAVGELEVAEFLPGGAFRVDITWEKRDSRFRMPH